MFDTICSLPLSADLFAQCLHPHEPLLAVGLATGHVATLRLPPVVEAAGSDDSERSLASSVNGYGQIETAWRTRRHQGSCRSLAYSLDGRALFSAGTDGVVKAADTESGKVYEKIALPLDPSTSDIDAPSIMHVLSPQTLLLATDSSALHLYDLRTSSKSSSGGPTFSSRKPQQTHHPHADYISSLTPLPPSEASTSGYSKQWVTTGGTTLSITDLRRGVLVRSEDQEEILLSSTFVSGLSAKRGGTSKGEKVIVGGGSGVLTLWERGVWDDQDERIVVDKGEAPIGGESLDVVEMVPEGQGIGKVVAVGLGDGSIKFVRLGPNKVVDQVRHDDVEGVVSIGFDVGGRMISGGGSIIKVWHEKVDEDQGRYLDVEDNGMSPSDDEGEGQQDDDDDSSSEEEEQSRKRRKKRKTGKGKAPGGDKSAFSFTGLD